MPFICKKRNIKGQFVRTFNISKYKLLKLYNKENLTTRDICDSLSVSYIQIYKLFKEYNIKLVKKKKKRLITYCCKFCGNGIGHTSALRGNGLCNYCANTKENNPNYIDGRTENAKYYCRICNKEISISSYKYGKGRCSHCYRLSHPPVKIKHYKYKNNNFRSSWELFFCQVAGFIRSFMGV